jgi:dephospho-CoA kinase
MLKIGLTGGIGSGKSLVSTLFENLGVTVVDSDLIAHELTEAGSPLTQEIEKHFGKSVMENGHLNRAALAKIIFADPEAKLWLEKLLHPAIIKKMLEAAQKSQSSYCIFVIPLLIEGQYQHLVDRILVVDAPIELQIQRTKIRDKRDEAQIQAIINAQSSREKKLAAADDVIINDGSLEKLEKAVFSLHEKYLGLRN